MDVSVSSLLFSENIDDFFNYCPTPLPVEILGDEYNQTTEFGLKNDPLPCKLSKRKSTIASNGSDELDHKRRKKNMHRDFEKQRRQEMASLYKSLRSLMPLQYLKGRSVADHMQGVVSYIKQMQKRVEGLNETRDSLRKTLNQEAINSFSKYLLHYTNQHVKVEVSKIGYRVMIVSTGLVNEGIPLSRVLDVLDKEGLTVISSISTIANENMVHIIESQVNEGMTINPSELENKFSNF